ncbi:general transcription factor II-I repeat domain-containing protein 2 [Trichonephila clavata]|uniref:General transcription factor II-I repeat domain-containing protein 2 n=1 Tax=Trichonephila clavata TaxID=2740835 RepID=A0A8X6KWJ8_TRICU|nr:general transcription factor II-I repeat domain-containing protein 2 [Trichonephila clavata]
MLKSTTFSLSSEIVKVPNTLSISPLCTDPMTPPHVPLLFADLPLEGKFIKNCQYVSKHCGSKGRNIAENISSQLFDKNGHVEWFSLALDESTDVSDTAQVLLYIRGVDKSYEVHEELLDMYSIHGTTTGRDIFKGVEMVINQKNLRWKNLKCITTDGGKNMSGKDKGVVALVSKTVENDGG